MTGPKVLKVPQVAEALQVSKGAEILLAGFIIIGVINLAIWLLFGSAIDTTAINLALGVILLLIAVYAAGGDQ